MLPRLLCEELCSLNPNVDRLSFSVVWKMDQDGNVIGEPWFGRSVIRSCAKLSCKVCIIQEIHQTGNLDDLTSGLIMS